MPLSVLVLADRPAVYTSGITLEGLLDLEMTMNDNAVPAENRVLLIGSRQAMQLKMIPEYINQLNVGYHCSNSRSCIVVKYGACPQSMLLE